MVNVVGHSSVFFLLYKVYRELLTSLSCCDILYNEWHCVISGKIYEVMSVNNFFAAKLTK